MISAVVDRRISAPEADDRFGRFALDPTRPPDARDKPQPRLKASLLVVEFDEPNRVDPVPAVIVQQPPGNERRPAPLSQYRSRYSVAAWALAVGVYVVTLLLLLPWAVNTSDPEPPIPVSLVIQQPPPPPPLPRPPADEQKRPPGRLASRDVGDVTPRKEEAAAPPDSTPDSPEQQVAAITPPPKPVPPPTLESPLPKPTTAPENTELPDIPKPAPAYKEAPKEPPRHVVTARLAPRRRNPVPRSAEILGPAASRDEYFAYCEEVIRHRYGMLPASFLAGRSGVASFRIYIRDDGTITRITLERSSGYTDIDERIERMVEAIHRFPPLPQWFQGPVMPVMYQQVISSGELK